MIQRKFKSVSRQHNTVFKADKRDCARLQFKTMLNGRCASVQRAAEPPPVVRRTAPSNMRIKLTAKLKNLSAFSLLAAYPPPVRWTALRAAFAKYRKQKTLLTIAKIFIFLINLATCVIIKSFARTIIYSIFLFMFWEQVILLIYRLVVLIFHITKK